MEMRCKLQATAALLSGKKPPFISEQEAEWVLDPVWMQWLRKKSPSRAQNRTPVFQPFLGIHSKYRHIPVCNKYTNKWEGNIWTAYECF